MVVVKVFFDSGLTLKVELSKQEVPQIGVLFHNWMGYGKVVRFNPVKPQAS